MLVIILSVAVEGLLKVTSSHVNKCWYLGNGARYRIDTRLLQTINQKWYVACWIVPSPTGDGTIEQATYDLHGHISYFLSENECSLLFRCPMIERPSNLTTMTLPMIWCDISATYFIEMVIKPVPVSDASGMCKIET